LWKHKRETLFDLEDIQLW